MSTLAEQSERDEIPTKRSENFPTAMLVLAARVDRLAEVALEKLSVEPDAQAIADACADLAQIRALAAEVIR